MNRRNFIGKLTAALAIAPAFVKAEPKKRGAFEVAERHKMNVQPRMTATEIVERKGRFAQLPDHFVSDYREHWEHIAAMQKSALRNRDEIMIKALK